LDKFLITFKSGNRITGPIMITTSPRSSCPTACPFRKDGDSPEAGVCYAEHGHLGHYIWNGLDRTPPGKKISNRIPVYSFDDLLKVVRDQPDGTLWRHNQAGDLPSFDRITIDRARLKRLTAANRGRSGFTYTHFGVVDNSENCAAIKEANDDGFTINLSADSLDEADELAELAIAPVTVVVPATVSANTTTPAGRKVVICPARTHPGVTCATCGLCARQRACIVAFPALGPAKERIAAVLPRQSPLIAA
jgi:hypothetical protein